MIDGAGTEYVDCSDVELSYYPDLVFDVINRTETACPQRHTFEVMRLAIRAQQSATMMGFAQVNGPADTETLRVGIVGCGSIARSHALSYQNNARVELVGVVDVDPARAG